MIDFFNWGLLEAGGYDDVNITNPGIDDPLDDATLRPVHTPGLPDGRVWQSNFRNWVWEDGLESEQQPISVSGVYVDGAFHNANDAGPFKFFTNYKEGRILFEHAIPTTSLVQASYSYRWVNFYDQDVPWFRDVIFDAYRFEIGTDVPTSGFVGLLQKNQVQLPAVIIETVPNRRFIPRQLGDGSQILYQDFLFHILTENSADRSFLIDTVTLQQDKTFYLYDVNARATANQFALDWHGNKIPGAKQYPDLVQMPPTGFRYHKCVFNKMVGQDSSARLPLFRAIIRVTLEVDFTELV